MEDSNEPNRESYKIQPKRKIGRRSKGAIIAIVIVVIISTLAFYVPATANNKHQILQAGNYLQYDFSGSYNNSSFNSSRGSNITVADASESGVNYFMIGEGYYLISNLGHDFKFFYGAPKSGQIVGAERISTSFGSKYVSMVYWLDMSNDELVLIDVGIDSYLVYRWTVSSMSGLYHYTYELTESNNSMIMMADKTARNVNIEVLNTPAPKACTSSSFGYFQPGMGSAYCYGSVQTEQGQQLHYVIGGNATIYVMDYMNLKNIDTNGQFQFREDLSRFAGDPGETNVSVEPGIYWFVVVCKGSETSIEFSGQPTSGYFIAYFGLKGQDF